MNKTASSSPITLLFVPGLRDHVEEHWQTLLAVRLPRVRSVPPMGREDLDCARRVAAIEIERCPHCKSGRWQLVQALPADRAALASILPTACRGPP